MHKACKTARHLVRLNKLRHTSRRVLDSWHDNAPAWTVLVCPSKACAVVVYEDSPNTAVSLGWEPKRWLRGM